MFDPLTGWSRLMASGHSMVETGLRAIETLGAAHEVVAARSGIIGAAMRSPLTGDYAELGGMLPEKVEAFSRAGSATVAVWRMAHSAWMGQMQHLGTMAMRGRAPTPADLADLGSRMATLTLESIEAGARLSSDSLAPLHRRVTTNARRLRRKATRVSP